MKIIHDNKNKQILVDSKKGEDCNGLADMNMVMAELKKQKVKVGKFKKVNYSTYFFARYIFEMPNSTAPAPKPRKRTASAKSTKESEQ